MADGGRTSKTPFQRAPRPSGSRRQVTLNEAASATWPTPRAEDSEQTGAHRGVADTLTSAAKAASWTTPTATDARRGSAGPRPHDKGLPLNQQLASAWPTPDASDAGKTSRSGDRKDEPLLGGIVRTSWPTPQARDEKGQTQNPERPDSVPNLVHTWPTPQVHQGPNNSENRGSSHGGKRRRLTPQNPSDLIKTWPTPVCPAPHDSEASVARGRERREGYGVELRDLVNPPEEVSPWPTPRNNTGPGNGRHASVDGVLGGTSFGCLAQTEKFVVRLTTLSAWLMGYTAAYLRLWETASARRSRPQSSAPAGA
jgi:hypothetical protein